MPFGNEDEIVDQVRAEARVKTTPVGLAENLRPAVERSSCEQPIATLAMAAALGSLLGALWKT